MSLTKFLSVYHPHEKMLLHLRLASMQPLCLARQLCNRVPGSSIHQYSTTQWNAPIRLHDISLIAQVGSFPYCSLSKSYIQYSYSNCKYSKLLLVYNTKISVPGILSACQIHSSAACQSHWKSKKFRVCIS